MNKIVIEGSAGCEFPVEMFVFNGGEVNVKLPMESMAEDLFLNGHMVIKAKIVDSNGVMALLLTKNALDRSMKYLDAKKTLHLAYLPYARQDRVCNEGEALSIEVFASLINSMNFNRVITVDNHSEVATALINNCYNIPPEAKMSLSGKFDGLKDIKVNLCSPDAGANKKTYQVSKMFGGLPVIRADKIRDVSTGQITHTEVYCDDLNGKAVLVVDDICDGGMTFIKLAEKLKEKGAGILMLYVTHGIFSKGLDPLYEAGYDSIFTTDSFLDESDEKFHSERLTIINS